MTVTTSGRPLRFFALLILGWVAFRAAVIWMDEPNSLARPLMRLAPMPVRSFAMETPTVSTPGPGARKGKEHDAFRPERQARHHHPHQISRDIPLHLAGFSPPSDEAAPSGNYGSPVLAIPAPEPHPSPYRPSTDRWRASAWLFWRDGGDVPHALSPGRLGASQAGIRIDFLLAPSMERRATAYGRISGALDHPIATEAALGISLQPVPGIPVSIGIERRIALGEGGRNANAALIVGGFGPTVLFDGVEAEGYTQMGMVGLRGRDLFADGKLSLLSRIGKSSFRIGGSLSGGAQPDLERLDIGPELQWRLPLPDANARIVIEWRERIAGRARPPSGLAMTLATDF